MKNLKAPILLNHKELFAEIVKAKKAPIVVTSLTSKSKSVFKRLTLYTQEFQTKSLINITDSPFDPGDEELLSCYLSGGKKIAAIKKQIKDLQDIFGNEKCMYCQISRPNSFDHYLPKDTYPEFCAFALNLIPCCTICNQKKDVYWKELGEIGIINFYLNNIPKKQILFAGISFSQNNYATPIISFELRNINKISSKNFGIFKRHFTRLGLIDLYNESSGSAISELKRTLNSFGGAHSVAKNMKNTLDYANQLKKDYGNNYWKAVLFDRLSNEKRFFKEVKI